MTRIISNTFHLAVAAILCAGGIQLLATLSYMRIRSLSSNINNLQTNNNNNNNNADKNLTSKKCNCNSTSTNNKVANKSSSWMIQQQQSNRIITSKNDDENKFNPSVQQRVLMTNQNNNNNNKQDDSDIDEYKNMDEETIRKKIRQDNIIVSMPIDPNDMIRPKQIYYEELTGLDKIPIVSLINGKKEMKKHKIVICGITRDEGWMLRDFVRLVEHITPHFNDYRVIIFENDSVDDTKSFLKEWSTKNNKINPILKNFGESERRKTIGILAYARNHYIAELATNPEYQDFDIVMVIDLDMKRGFDIRGLYNTFYNYNQWEAVCSNGIYTTDGKMHDVFAYRDTQFFSNDISDPNYWNVTVIKGWDIKYQVDDGFIPVTSCFGGMALYKRKFIYNCNYDSYHNGTDCEHVPFHQCIKENGGRMYVNPAQTLRYNHYNDFEAF